MKVGDLSGPISTARTGVVAKIVDKQEPSAEEIAKNLDQTRDQILEQRRNDAFGVFLSSVMDEYKKSKRIQLNAKANAPQVPGM
jgi:peptidyl-prolyl cis-trans isomerase D